MENFTTFGDAHFELLREIGNIGAGNAVTSLSKMLHKKVKMKVPRVQLMDLKEIASFVGGPEKLIIGVLVQVSGDINGLMMFIVEENSAFTLIELLLGQQVHDIDGFTEMQLSALQEIGNILTGSYICSLATLINKIITPSIPMLSIDMAGAILSVPAIEFGQASDQVLFVESTFQAESQDVSGYFILVPDIPSFQTIFSSIGVD